MALLMAELKAYRPRRLGVRARGYCVFSEIAEALVLAMTGTWRPIPLTTGKLGEAIFSEHIIIDRELIKYLMPGKVWYGAAFGMKHFPAWTWPGMFAALLATPYTNTVFHYFRFIPTATAQGIMKRKTYRMLTAEDPAESQALALKRAADELGSSDYVFGDYSFTFLVFGRSLKALDDIATTAWGNLADSGMVVAREMAGLEAALFSMVPGNARLRPRPGYLSSRNLTAMAPLHAYPTGPRRGYWGEPVAIFRTGGGVAYYFHLQVGDVGNAFLCGRTGSGKTTWMAFIVCQSERLGATVILFDKDRCLKILVNALGGIYLELDNPTGLAPLKALTELGRGHRLPGGPDPRLHHGGQRSASDRRREPPSPSGSANRHGVTTSGSLTRRGASLPRQRTGVCGSPTGEVVPRQRVWLDHRQRGRSDLVGRAGARLRPDQDSRQ